MKRVLMLTSDHKLAYQVDMLLRELPEAVKLVRVTDLDQLQATIESESLAGSGGAKNDQQLLDAKDIGSGKSGASSDSNKFNLFIVDEEDMPDNPIYWIKCLKTELKEKGLVEPDLEMRVMVMAFEGPALSVFRQQSVDDLVLKPIDRSLVLQKVEILIADELNINPTFLFRQKVQVEIEIGKDATIDELSEFGIAIRNPTPLAESVYASIHCSIFGLKEDSRVIGRVYSSGAHPTVEKAFSVRMSFFALSQRQIDSVRKYLRAEKLKRDGHASGGGRSSLSGAAKSKSAVDQWLAQDQYIERPGVRNRVAAIDMNQFTLSELKSALETNFGNVEVVAFPSYSRFMSDLNQAAVTRTSAPDLSGLSEQSMNHLDQVLATAKSQLQGQKGKGEKLGKKQEPKGTALPGGLKLTFVMSAKDHSVARFEPVQKPADLVFGLAVSEWLQAGTDFFRFVHPLDLEGIEEFFSYVTTGAKGKIVFRVLDQSKKLVYVEADGRLEKSGDVDGFALLRVDMREIDEAKWTEASGSVAITPQAMCFDAIFIDGAIIRKDPQEWLDHLVEMMGKAGVSTLQKSHPKIFVMADEGARIRVEPFKIRGISDFLYKPLDRKTVVHKTHALLPELSWKQSHEENPFLSCEIKAKLAKGVMMAELSEYGVSILHPTAFKAGSYIRFFSPLFSDDPEGVIGRCAYNEPPDEKEEEKMYHCHFHFFGATDDVLKRIRTWIREDYVAQKDKKKKA